MANTIKKIESIKLKSHFKSESGDFTPWLADNLDYVSEAIHLKLLNPSTEQTSENFRVDILAELENGSGVVVENQFGDSNHDHLGKIITYRTAFDAKVAIWIVERAKEEHVEAVNWLNETDNGCDFYLLELQLIRIGDSPLGPLFTIKSAPSKEAREKGEIKRQETHRHEMRFKFWTELLKVFKADKTMPAFKNNSATKDSFITSGTGISGIAWTLWVAKDSVRCELRIDRGAGAEKENLEILHKLMENKDQVDKEYGPGLNWSEMPGYQLTSIRTEFPGGYNLPEEDWPALLSEIHDNTKRFVTALKGPVSKLKV